MTIFLARLTTIHDVPHRRRTGVGAQVDICFSTNTLKVVIHPSHLYLVFNNTFPITRLRKQVVVQSLEYKSHDEAPTFTSPPLFPSSTCLKTPLLLPTIFCLGPTRTLAKAKCSTLGASSTASRSARRQLYQVFLLTHLPKDHHQSQWCHCYNVVESYSRKQGGPCGQT